MMQICACCKQDTAGNHEWGCPMNPNYASTPRPLYAMYCIGCNAKDIQISDLQRQLAEANQKLAEWEHEVAAQKLELAWRQYQWLFGEPPHGTLKQLRALLELIPVKPPESEG